MTLFNKKINVFYIFIYTAIQKCWVGKILFCLLKEINIFIQQWSIKFIKSDS